MWESGPISRVLSWTTIPLGRPLLTGSSHLPADSASRVIVCLFGVAPDGGYRVSPFATQPLTRRSQRLVSVALFLASRRPAVSRHPALWSPDFPLPRREGRGSGCLVRFPVPIIGPARARAWIACARLGQASPCRDAGQATTRQRTASPARRGTSASSPSARRVATSQDSRRSVIEPALRGSP